ncbi:DUF5071 domain-containing protein [Paenibacillus doosanensis]|uniref:DUF5071 domain-containing protein n=1 Tax=Paenibacillus konkukensis TaxID=2020716 RepID=A0ABY4RJR4_9BACL|nr:MULTISPECIES: DUF5071 domain-containing protein [Paenibacillus]MCS7462724.1 DUF5071 domain-containing protein [Paenibacillus doosanensis]UQZ82350.1 hypothetical protein SK3146_01507 [Paenibacillus konkukensis]
MDYTDLVPQHKFDFERIALLKTQSLDAIRSLIPELLKWLQDGNWPIFTEIQSVLLPFDRELVPHLRTILKLNDGDWKYFLLMGLVRRLSEEALLDLKQDIMDIAHTPTTSDRDSGADEIAKELLDAIYCMEGKRET